MQAQAASDVTNAFLLLYAGLFPIIKPIGNAPIFLGLTRHCAENEPNALAWHVTAIAGLIAVAATIYVCYRFAEGTVGALGEHGTDVPVRLAVFILLCIGIESIWNGFSALVHIAGQWRLIAASPVRAASCGWPWQWRPDLHELLNSGAPHRYRRARSNWWFSGAS